MEEVRKLLNEIQESIPDPVRVGPYGPTIGRPGHYESWDSWGAGSPLPIAGFRPWESIQGGVVEFQTIRSISRMVESESKSEDVDRMDR
ncbi:hypothetical protein [Streptomyces goshikiensis]|uniref:hypothetical protein n=1 Tax=Streptomyces goshikiensis TaxID=1942 RepID=UPI0033AAFA6D